MTKVKEVPDKTGRFPRRPFYRPEDLDIACEHIITKFLHSLHGKVEFPISTEDLKRLIEKDTSDLDCYADLSEFGADVEGVTLFSASSKPEVRISSALTEDERRENRLRTTLTHEYGHVHFHSYLFELRNQPSLLAQTTTEDKIICKRDGILNAKEIDWMEWQAGYVCGAILMPKSYVTRHIQKFREQNQFLGSIGLGSKEADTLISEITSVFQVSREAAKIRLLKLNHLTTNPEPSLFDHR